MGHRDQKISFDIQCDTFHQRAHILAPDFVFFEREQVFKKDSVQVDAFGATWFFGAGYCPKGAVGFGRADKIIEVEGPMGYFMPPFSLVEWHMRPSLIQWAAFSSERPLPPGMPREAICFPWPARDLPGTMEEIFEFLISLKAGQYQIIEKLGKPSALAAQVKSAIDRSYSYELKIGELARQLNVSRVVMGRAFKQAYGITPVAYRSRLRVIHSLARMRQGDSITEAAFNSGFAHLSRYNRQFREMFSASPRDFSPEQATRKRPKEGPKYGSSSPESGT